jgi:hypothetical protein
MVDSGLGSVSFGPQVDLIRFDADTSIIRIFRVSSRIFGCWMDI